MVSELWKTIRRLQRTFLGLEAAFIVSGLVLIPSYERFFSFLFVFFAVGMAVLVFWPAPCPQCNKPFLLWNIRNFWFAVELAFKDAFHPFRYMGRYVFPSCPHCNLSMGAELPNP
jgi:hypothetical protein